MTPSRSESIAMSAASVARNFKMNVVMCSEGKRVKSFKALCFLGKKEYSTSVLCCYLCAWRLRYLILQLQNL